MGILKAVKAGMPNFRLTSFNEDCIAFWSKLEYEHDNDFSLFSLKQVGRGWKKRVIAMDCESVGQKKGLYKYCLLIKTFKFGAEEKTRTSTRILPLDPEPSASTNSATSATLVNMLVLKGFVKTFFMVVSKKNRFDN